MAQTVSWTARSVLTTGREGGAGLWATGSLLSRLCSCEAAGQPGRLGSTAFEGTAPQDWPGAGKGGCTAAFETLLGALAVVLKGQLPARVKASRQRNGSEAGANWEGGVGPDPETSRQKPETAWLAGSQDRLEGGGRLKSEPREQLRVHGVEGGGTSI